MKKFEKAYSLTCIHGDPGGREVSVCLSLESLGEASSESAGKNLCLVARFEVIQPSDLEYHLLPKLSKTDSAKGLWEGDVVEIFIKPRENDARYYEFEVSPLGQYLEVEILEPRIEVNFDFRSQVSVQSALISSESGCQIGTSDQTPKPLSGVIKPEIGKKTWKSQISVPLWNLYAEGVALTETDLAQLSGGCFACLGKPENRSFWGVFLPKQNQPDFHLPQFFRRFFL